MAIEEERKAKIRLTQEQLDRVCERHKRFMEGRPNGSRANMPFFDLSGLDFAGKNLTGAHLSGAILRDARMMETVLERSRERRRPSSVLRKLQLPSRRSKHAS